MELRSFWNKVESLGDLMLDRHLVGTINKEEGERIVDGSVVRRSFI